MLFCNCFNNLKLLEMLLQSFLSEDNSHCPWVKKLSPYDLFYSPYQLQRQTSGFKRRGRLVSYKNSTFVANKKIKQ